MKRTILLTAFLVTGIFCFNALAGVLEISPSEAIVIEPPENNNDDYLGPRLLLSFALPDSISDKDIAHAEIKAEGDFPAYDGMDIVTLDYYPVTTEWNSEATWAYPWAEDGGDFNDDIGGFFTVEVGDDRLTMIDVTTTVRAWNDSSLTNRGIIVIPRKFNQEAYTSFSQGSSILSNIKLRIKQFKGFGQ